VSPEVRLAWISVALTSAGLLLIATAVLLGAIDHHKGDQ